MFDKSAVDITQEGVKNKLTHIPGFQTKSVRRPAKTKAPDWVYNDKKLQDKIFAEARLKYQIAYHYWRLGWNSREIAEHFLKSREKFKAVESILFRIKNL
jgi:hypothetical protein